jgi:hypothetical protein
MQSWLESVPPSEQIQLRALQGVRVDQLVGFSSIVLGQEQHGLPPAITGSLENEQVLGTLRYMTVEAEFL